MDELRRVLFGGPCCFCGYNGSGFFNVKTHRANCPYHDVGGLVEREQYLIKKIRERKLRIIPGVFEGIEDYYKE